MRSGLWAIALVLSFHESIHVSWTTVLILGLFFFAMMDAISWIKEMAE